MQLPYGIDPGFVAASGICLAAFFKSSQWPLTQLLARSMEGPTPSSAMGYGGLSAHIGIVFLANTMPLWYPYEFWQGVVIGGGLVTTLFSTLVSQIRADRKGAVAYATSATLGGLYTLMGLGYSDTALALCFGHAACRMIQVFRASNIIAEKEALATALGAVPMWPSKPPEWLYKLAWRCRRMDTDFNLLEWSVAFSREAKEHLKLTRTQQWAATAGIGVLVGAPFTPYIHAYEHTVMELAHTKPEMAVALGLTQFGVSVVLLRFLFARVLDPFRFQRATVFDGSKSQRAVNFDRADRGPIAAALTGSLMAVYMISQQMMGGHSHCDDETQTQND